MPARVKAHENMTKHLTNAEADARSAAESEILPDRGRVDLQMPAYVKRDAAARKYWRSILERMDGLAILDDLDAEILGVYCAMLSRREGLDSVCRELMAQALSKDMDPDERLAITNKLDSLIGKLQSHEKTMLTYADKLGLTPTGRVSLARKRSSALADEVPDADLFGD